MLTHPELDALIDGQADAGVQAHLAGCARCRVRLRLYQECEPTAAPVATTPLPAQSTPSLPPTLVEPDRYVNLGLIQRGGMGEVRRVYDRRLDRTLVMKAMRAELVGGATRFLAEARGTARLQHPGIVPVHDLGRLPDGRLFYTMEEVRGRTLQRVIAQVHAAIQGGEWLPTADGWSLRRLVDALRKAAEAVAYAHSQGVIHRDLKPDNIMVGEFGSVRVVDWGLARVAAADPDLPEGPTLGATRPGALAGTPAYMAPEQALEGLAAAGRRADVYSLGASLYHLLSGGRPYADQAMVLDAVRQGPPAPLHPAAPVDTELLAVCHRAMAREPDDRFPDAGAFAQALGDWLEDARARDRALESLDQARQLGLRVDALRDAASDRAAAAAAGLAGVPEHAPVAQRQRWWAVQDDAAELDKRAAALDAEQGRLLRTALERAPRLPEARQALSDWYRGHILRAEREGRPDEVAAWERLLRDHDPQGAPAWLDGPGQVELVTDPPGARVHLHSYRSEGRRLVLHPAGELGVTPVDVAVPRGSHVLVLHAPGCEATRYPVRIDRGGRWRSRRPGDVDPTPVPLPPLGSLGPPGRDAQVYVPPGWFLSGGPDARGRTDLQPVWVDGFVIDRFPVTNRAWLAWLNALLDEGRADEAMANLPRDRGREPHEDGPPIFGRGPDGRFRLEPDNDGDAWEPDVPVCMLTIAQVETYAADRARRTGLPWRLPHELEWEKAARGVDGRLFPMGEHIDPAWCHSLHSRPGKPLPAAVTEAPLDESPYGVRGLAGGIADWTADPMTIEPPARTADGIAIVGRPGPREGYRTTRGGTWIWHHRYARTDYRHAHHVDGRTAEIGVRLVRSWPAPPGSP